MTQDNAMSPDDSFVPDMSVHQITAARDERRKHAVARAISREIEGREMYWKDYLAAAEAAIEVYQREG